MYCNIIEINAVLYFYCILSPLKATKGLVLEQIEAIFFGKISFWIYSLLLVLLHSKCYWTFKKRWPNNSKCKIPISNACWFSRGTLSEQYGAGSDFALVQADLNTYWWQTHYAGFPVARLTKSERCTWNTFKVQPRVMELWPFVTNSQDYWTHLIETK